MVTATAGGNGLRYKIMTRGKGPLYRPQDIDVLVAETLKRDTYLVVSLNKGTPI